MQNVNHANAPVRKAKKSPKAPTPLSAVRTRLTSLCENSGIAIPEYRLVNEAGSAVIVLQALGFRLGRDTPHL